MMINLHSIAHPVCALGPGHRVALWVSGCKKRCEGCISPELQNPMFGRLIKVNTLLSRLLSINSNIEGITISGGEPMDQKESLGEFPENLRAARPDWNVLVYSGYTMNDIKDMGESAYRLLSLIDILIDGPFDKNAPSTHPLLGSGNQNIHYLSNNGLALKPLTDKKPNGIFDLGLGPDNFQMLIGVGAHDRRTAIINGLHV